MRVLKCCKCAKTFEVPKVCTLAEEAIVSGFTPWATDGGEMLWLCTDCNDAAQKALDTLTALFGEKVGEVNLYWAMCRRKKG